jgi:uncharacterized membrane protein YeaQ/YmgE (transglycosylase-associated protein family)
MNYMDYLWFIPIGLIAGWLAGHLTEGTGFGIIGDIVVGVLGALLGGFLFHWLGLWSGGVIGGWSSGRFIGSLIVATIGAAILLFVLRVFHWGRKKRHEPRERRERR